MGQILWVSSYFHRIFIARLRLYTLQVWTVSLPVVILNSPAVSRAPGGNPRFGTASDIIGIILWAIGWSIESIADAQKVRFGSQTFKKAIVF